MFVGSTGTLAQSVTPAPLVITANDQNKVYGAPLPALTASYSGFVNGDTAANLTMPPTLSTTATAGSHVAGNPYSITVIGATAANYSISYVPGTLTVTPASLSITADNKNKVYGAALPSLTASYSGFVNGDTSASLSTPPTLSTSATATSPAGSYPITASNAADADYTISYVPSTLTIYQAGTVVGITASSPTSVFGEPITFSASVVAVAPGTGIPTGTVAFKRLFPDGSVVTFGTGTLDATGAASFVMDHFVPATATVFAVYLGDTDYSAGTSMTITHVINKANTALVLTANVTTVSVGQAVNFFSTLYVVPPGAFVAPPTGTITLYDTYQGVTTVLSVSPFGTSVAIPPFTTVGTHVITSEYSGDGNFNGSISAPLTITVLP
jgi:hypothetical protein